MNVDFDPAEIRLLLDMSESLRTYLFAELKKKIKKEEIYKGAVSKRNTGERPWATADGLSFLEDANRTMRLNVSILTKLEAATRPRDRVDELPDTRRLKRMRLHSTAELRPGDVTHWLDTGKIFGTVVEVNDCPDDHPRCKFVTYTSDGGETLWYEHESGPQHVTRAVEAAK